MQQRVALTIMATTSAHWFGTARARQRDIHLGLVSSGPSAQHQCGWQPMLDAMHKATGLKVKVLLVPDDTGLIEAMRVNQAQVGWFGSRAGASDAAAGHAGYGALLAEVARGHAVRGARRSAKHPAQLMQTRETWQSPVVPEDPLVWRRDLEASVKLRIRDFLLRYSLQSSAANTA